MIARDGDRLAVSGDLSFATAAGLLEAGREHIAAGQIEFDLAGAGHVDSAGLAVLFGWQRSAQAEGKSLRLLNLPQALRSIADLYGVDDLPPLA